MGGGEGRVLARMGGGRGDGRERGEVHLVALGRVDLGHEAAVGEGRRVAEREALAVAGDHRLKRREAVDDPALAPFEAAGFVDAGIEVTREYDRDALEAMGDMLDPAQLPASMSMDDAVEALEGAFASAFIRATKPRG